MALVELACATYEDLGIGRNFGFENSQRLIKFLELCRDKDLTCVVAAIRCGMQEDRIRFEWVTGEQSRVETRVEDGRPVVFAIINSNYILPIYQGPRADRTCERILTLARQIDCAYSPYSSYDCTSNEVNTSSGVL